MIQLIMHGPHYPEPLVNIITVGVKDSSYSHIFVASQLSYDTHNYIHTKLATY